MWTGRVGTANRVGRDNEWVFTPRFDDDDSQRYSVVVTDADDRSGNRGMKGVKDPDGKGAITFEIDKNMDEPTVKRGTRSTGHESLRERALLHHDNLEG